MGDEFLVVALCRDGADPTDLFQGRRQLVFDVAHEGFDGREAQIAGDRAVPPLAFDMFEKVEDQSGVELLDVQLRRRCSRAFGGKGKQQPEAVGVSLAGMRAVATLPGHVIAHEAGDQRSETGH